MRRWLKRVLVVLLAPPLAYLAAALLLALVPFNREFRHAADGVTVYLRTNGVHADLVLPARSGEFDWTADHPALHTEVLQAPLAWLAFGWGDREFYLNTPTWRELHAGTALRALSGRGHGAMHVQYLDDPRAYEAQPIVLTPAQYKLLQQFIRASFVRDADGKPLRIPARGFSGDDAFYEAQTVYTFWRSCNEWVRQALQHAQVRVPAWAPFDEALFFQLRQVPR